MEVCRTYYWHTDGFMPIDSGEGSNYLVWINRLSLSVLDPQEVAYVVVIGAKDRAIEYIEDNEIQKDGK